MLLKVCGNKEIDNFLAIDKLKVDYLGFIFHEDSARNVELNSLPGLAHTKVAVTVNKSIDFLKNLNTKFGITHFQLHGEESVEFCKELKSNNFTVWKAVRVYADFDFNSLKYYEGCVELFVLDNKGKTHGGTGQKFDWSVLSKYTLQTPFLLSGGIRLQDAEEINKLNHSKLKGLDINSGFEEKPGYKNLEEIQKFIKKTK